MDLYHVLSMIVIRVKHLVVGHACTRDKLNSTHQNVYFFFKVHLLIYISRQIVSLVFNIIFETAPPLLSDIFLLLNMNESNAAPTLVTFTASGLIISP